MTAVRYFSFTSVGILPALKIQNFRYVAPCTMVVPNVSKDRRAFIFEVKRSKTKLFLDSSWPWRSRRHDPAKRRTLSANPYDVTYQKIWIFSNTAVRTPPISFALSRVFTPAKYRTAMNHTNIWHSCIDTLTAHDNSPKTGYGAEEGVGDVSVERWANAQYKGRLSEIFTSTFGQEHHNVRSFRLQCFARSSFP